LAAKTDRNVILLPIFPNYANAIMEGKKKVEFRKLNIPVNIEYVFIYSTAPEKKIIGFFKVLKITKASPERLWKEFKHIGCVEKDFFFDYYSGYDYGLAIQVGTINRLNKPLPLTKFKKQTPPQSFSYIDNDLLEMFGI